MRFGRSCTRCRAYFVTDIEDQRICPWCVRVEEGKEVAELLEFADEITLG